MGASQSSGINTISNNITTDSFNSCPSVSANNSIIIDKANFNPNPQLCAGTNPTFTLDQSAHIDAQCLIGNMTNATADAVSQLSGSAKGGLGYTGTDNQTAIAQRITSSVQNICADVSSTNQARLSDLDVTACTFKIVQNASANDMCVINNLQKFADQASAATKAEASGTTIGSLLFGNSLSTGIFMFLLLIIIVVGVIMVARTQKKNGNVDKAIAVGAPELALAQGALATPTVGGAIGSSCNVQMFAIVALIIIFLLYIAYNVKA